MTDAPYPPRPRNGVLKVLLILDSLATLILAPLALFWGLMSGMSTTTTDNAAFANAYVLVNLTLPVAMVVGVVGAWIAFAARREPVAWVLMFAPLAWLVVSIAMLAMWPAT